MVNFRNRKRERNKFREKERKKEIQKLYCQYLKLFM